MSTRRKHRGDGERRKGEASSERSTPQLGFQAWVSPILKSHIKPEAFLPLNICGSRGKAF